MADLTEEQTRFLIHHKISPNSVFDASGMSYDDCYSEMKNEEKLFCFGLSPCMEGHTLRNRANQCIQCRTANITFTRRNAASGFIYVSASSKLRMLKVGYSKDPTERERTLNGFAYGGASDWTKIAHLKSRYAGQYEPEVHSKLTRYLSPQTYITNQRETFCREIFSCGYGTVRKTIVEVAGPESSRDIYQIHGALEDFNYENRERK